MAASLLEVSGSPGHGSWTGTVWPPVVLLLPADPRRPERTQNSWDRQGQLGTLTSDPPCQPLLSSTSPSSPGGVKGAHGGLLSPPGPILEAPLQRGHCHLSVSCLSLCLSLCLSRCLRPCFFSPGLSLSSLLSSCLFLPFSVFLGLGSFPVSHHLASSPLSPASVPPPPPPSSVE